MEIKIKHKMLSYDQLLSTVYFITTYTNVHEVFLILQCIWTLGVLTLKFSYFTHWESVSFPEFLDINYFKKMPKRKKQNKTLLTLT
jgi:hypothetical protein